MAIAAFQGEYWNSGGLNDYSSTCGLSHIRVASQLGSPNRPGICTSNVGSALGLCLESMMDIELIKSVGGAVPLLIDGPIARCGDEPEAAAWAAKCFMHMAASASGCVALANGEGVIEALCRAGHAKYGQVQPFTLVQQIEGLTRNLLGECGVAAWGSTGWPFGCSVVPRVDLVR